MNERYYTKYAAAAVRGELIMQNKTEAMDGELLKKPLEELGEEEYGQILDTGAALGMKLYHFKRSGRELPRVRRVLGFLHGIGFDTLLDVGSGRGVFLLPFMEEFPAVSVTAMDPLPKRAHLLRSISLGGATELAVREESICDSPLPDGSYDVVTLLEVLEHIPDCEAAIRNAVRIAKSYVVVTVPSKEDDNPEHIHLLTKEKLTKYFNAAGVCALSFGGVPGHLFMIGRK